MKKATIAALQLRTLLTAIALISLSFANAQNNIGIGTAPDASAKLDVSSTTQGMLVPRMTAGQRGLIATPATGLMVYQTDAPAGFYFYSGSLWSTISGSSSSTVTELIANKVGGTGETMPLATTTTPVTVVYNNATTSPTLGSYNTATGVYTIGVSGMYMISATLLGPDASPATNSVSYCLNLSINNATYGSNAGGIIYGIYPAVDGVTIPGTKSRGQFQSYVKLNAGDNVRIIAHGANSGIASQNPYAAAACNLTIMKMN